MGCEDREGWERWGEGAVLHNSLLGWGKPAGEGGAKLLVGGICKRAWPEKNVAAVFL